MASDWYLEILTPETAAACTHILRREAIRSALVDGELKLKVAELLARKVTLIPNGVTASFFLGVSDRGQLQSKLWHLNRVLRAQPLLFTFDDAFRRQVLDALNNPTLDPYWKNTVRQPVIQGYIPRTYTNRRREGASAFCHPRDFNRFYEAYANRTAILTIE